MVLSLSDVGTAQAIRILLSVAAAGVIFAVFFNRRRQQPVQAQQKAGRRAKAKSSKAGEDDSDFSDEPSDPLDNDNDDEEDPVAALERLPRVKLQHTPIDSDEMCRRAKEFYENMNGRRTVRSFSKRPVPLEVVENIVRVAGTAPSGAHTEPWTYVVVSDPEMKAQIRQIVEREEELNYDRRMGSVWVKDVALLGTDFSKPYLEDAPYLIIAFEQTSGVKPDGKKKHHYYSRLSAAISTGMLLTAIHYAGMLDNLTRFCFSLQLLCVQLPAIFLL